MENKVRISVSPAEDQHRVEALKRYSILNTTPEKSFDNIAKLATQFFHLPVALISFVDTENVFLKANIGIEEIRNSPRETSICSMALLTDEVTVLEDIPNAERPFLTDPLLAGELGFKFYAGAPLITHDGFRIGTICVIGKEPRSFSDNEKLMLKSMGRIVMDEIELRLQGILEAEQKILEAAGQAQRNFNSYNMLAKAPVAIGIVTGRELIIELANPKILEFWGKTEEVIGKSMKIALPELEGQPYLKIFDDVFTTGLPFFGNELCAVLLRNGTMQDVYFNFVYQPLKDSAGKTVSIMIVATEITAQITARKLVETSEKNLSGMVMNSTVGIGVLSGRALIIENANQPMLEIWGLTAEQAIGKSLLTLFPEPVNETFPKILIDIFDTRETIISSGREINFKTNEGSYRRVYVDVKYTPIFDNEGNVEHIVASVNDVTQLVKTRNFFEQIDHYNHTANKILMETIEVLALTNTDMLMTHEELTKTNESLINTLKEITLEEPQLYHLIAKLSENLHKAKGNIQHAIDTATVGTWDFNVNTFECSNTLGLKKLFGFYAEDNMTFNEAMAQVPTDYREKVMAAANATILNGDTYSIEYPAIGFRDQKLRWIRAIGKLNRNKEGVSTTFSGVAFEITTEKLAGAVR